MALLARLLGGMIASAALVAVFFGSVWAIADLLIDEWSLNRLVAHVLGVFLMLLVPIGPLLAIIGAIVVWGWAWYWPLLAYTGGGVAVLVGGLLMGVGAPRLGREL